MAKVHVKWEMPYNWYGLRKLKLDFGGGVKRKLAPSLECCYEFDILPEQLRIKLDFLTESLTIAPAEEVFLTIGLKGKSLGEWYRYSLNRHGLFLRQVEEVEYRQFNSEYYNVPMVIGKDWYSLILIAAASTYACYAGIISQQESSAAFSEFSFATGLIGFFTLASMALEKSTGKGYYLSRLFILVILFMITAEWASLNGVALAWFFATFPLILLLRTVYFVPRFANIS